jgi:integrase
MWRGLVLRESTKQTNKRVAEQMEAARKTALAKGEVGIRDREPVPTLQKFADEKFLPHVRATKSEKARTVTFYQTCVANVKAFPRLAALPLDQITGEVLGEYTAHRTAQGMKVSTINRDLATVRRMFNLAAEWGIATVRLAHVRMNPGETSRMRVLSESEEAAYLSAARKVGDDIETAYLDALHGIRATMRGEQPIRQDSYLLHDIALLLVDCGFRPEEVFRLRWPQLRDSGIHIEKGKGKGSRRRVPCTPRVLAMLEMRRPAMESDTWVFPGETASGHAEPSSIRDQHTRALELSSVRPFVPYDFRHTRITRWARTLSLPVVQRLAGHTEITTTMNYVHVSDDDVIAAMAEEQGRHKIGHSDEATGKQPEEHLFN